MSVYSKLATIQQNLRVGKKQNNDYGGFNYRTCSDILSALKPFLLEHQVALTMTDSLEIGNNRNYIRATVSLIDVETGEAVTSTALARETEQKKKMDEAQLTGSSSSYARKYALCGLLCIDDNADIDSWDNSQTNNNQQPQQQYQQQQYQPQQILCQQCGNGISDTQVNGKNFTTQQIIQNSMQKHGKPLCMHCMKTLLGGN